MKRREGKRVVVTGAASGIGRASAILFASEGAKVVASDVEPKGLAATVESIRAAGGTARAVVANAAEAAAVQGLVDESVREHGGLEVFYANAGVSGGLVPLLELEAEQWLELLKVN